MFAACCTFPQKNAKYHLKCKDEYRIRVEFRIIRVHSLERLMQMHSGPHMSRMPCAHRAFAVAMLLFPHLKAFQHQFDKRRTPCTCAVFSPPSPENTPCGNRTFEFLQDLDELLSGPCGLGAVWQSHPLYPEDFMLYYARPTQQLDQLPTDCISMITEETKQLDVIEWYQQPFLAPVLGNDSDPMNTVYPVCSDTQWEHTDWFSKYTVGPVQTWLLFYNSCPLQEANVRVSIERMGTFPIQYMRVTTALPISGLVPSLELQPS